MLDIDWYVLVALISIWLVITTSGLVYSVRLKRSAVAALAWLQSEGLNGYREIAARGAIHRGQIRVGMAWCMVIMGILAGANQFLGTASELRSVISASFRILFIVMACLFAYKAWLEEHELDLMLNESQRHVAQGKKDGRSPAARTRSTDMEG